MDPNAALAALRRLSKDFDGTAEEDYWTQAHIASQLIDSLTAIDEWLSNGGYLPEDWSR